MEGAPFTQFTFDPNASIHHTDQPRANCQSESGAAVYARHGTVGLGKRFEDFALFVGRDSNPGILDGEMQAHGIGGFTFLLHRDEDLSAFGELDGVAHQIDNDLADSPRVAHQRLGHVGLHLVDEFQPFLMRAVAQRLHGFPQTLSHLEGDRFHIQLARFYF